MPERQEVGGRLPPLASTPNADIEAVPVESSNLASVGYDDQSHTLEIRFRSGGRYRYYAVSPGVFEGLLAASSKGKYFNRVIKHTFGWTRMG